MHAKFWHTMCFLFTLMFTPMLTVFTGGCTEERDLILQPDVNSEQIVDDEEDLGNEYNGQSEQFVLDEHETSLIEQAYGEMTKDEWGWLINELAQFGPEDLEQWLEEVEDYVFEINNNPQLANCHYKDGNRVDSGFQTYTTSTNYSHLWTTNCYLYSSQCGSDLTLSFWMNHDYRGDWSKIRAYSASTTGRFYLNYWEGGYSAELYRSPSSGQYSVYACWPRELSYLKDHAQLKQMR